MIITTTEQIEILGRERPVGREVADDCFGQNTAAFEIVADDGWDLRPRQIDVDVLQPCRFADLVNAVGIRRAAYEQFVDGIGDQRFGRPAFLFRVAAGADDNWTLTLASHMRFEGLGKRRKIAVVVNGQEQPYQAGTGAAQAPRLTICSVPMRFGKAPDELCGAFPYPPLAPRAVQYRTYRRRRTPG